MGAADKKHHVKPYTYEGVTYPSFTEFCRAHNAHPGTVYARLKQGITGPELFAPWPKGKRRYPTGAKL